ncbi:hypothetical protein XH99_28595 [Bradyrhizobium nanningense]|uniref:Uncharacterized protein n=1 Tax=Bradyrhizobium nanningense TaxID=1325118 RepID=A0A4Q0RYS8_9BRAD|nr:hypothetical protein [Bradyrhizobium nanningense]RXH24055.1 hypothetical protein XH99_28595 [Bradyrhizobium nanningense]
MSGDAFAEALVKLVPAFAKAWTDRPKKKAARAVAELMFWPDGMLEQLEKLAQGKGTDEDVAKLRKKLAKSRSKVAGTLQGLAGARDALLRMPDGVFVVAQINALLAQGSRLRHVDGKRGLRDRIGELLQEYEEAMSIKNKKEKKLRLERVCTSALLLCNSIEAFNAAAARFRRYVFA